MVRVDKRTGMADREIAQKLRLARLNRGLSMAMVAKEIGTDEASVWRWEQNKTTPSFNRIVDLAQLYRMTVTELTGY